MHPEWREDKYLFFEWIINNIGHRPTSKHSLDRIDNDGNYEPGNLRWATWIEQNSNTRRTKMVTYNGEKMTQSECARKVGLSRQRINAMSKQPTNYLGIVFHH